MIGTKDTTPWGTVKGPLKFTGSEKTNRLPILFPVDMRQVNRDYKSEESQEKE